MEKKIVLVTSIAPKNIENQRTAMKSWIANGFKLISCNVREEIEIIKDEFPDIEFVEVTRDARKIAGKPCPYLYDMLQILKKHAGTICGIVNSDIHLRKFSKGMYEYIKEQAMESVIFLRRQEIDKIEDADCLKSKMFFGGVDTYIFHKDIIDLIEDDGLIIGQAMWDYWFPIILNAKGVMIRELINPLTFHVTHTFQYSTDVRNDLAWDIVQKYYTNVEKKDMIYYLNDRFLEIISSLDRAICYMPDELQKKRVLVIGKNSVSKEILEDMLASQTHSEVVCMKEEEAEVKLSQYDYVITVPYILDLNRVFISAVIWLMENYNIEAVRMFMYLRGDRSNLLKIENTNDTILGNFNDNIEPMVACKAEEYEAYKNGRHVLQKCQVCICSVNVEEDYELVFMKNKLKGRVLLFPAGIRSRSWLSRYGSSLETTDIVGFVDNDVVKQDTMLDGLKVYSPEVLKDVDFYDKVLVNTRYYTEEIYEQLSGIIPKDKIIRWDDMNLFDGKRWKKKYEDALRKM